MNDAYPNDPKKLAYAREVMQRKARDHARTPVQWSSAANAGFCKEDVQPWMRVNDDYKSYNAEAQLAANDPDELSVLQFWRRGLKNRKEHKDVFVYGEFTLLDEKHETVFAYKRSSEKEAFVTVLNFSGETVSWTVPEEAKVQKWVAGNYESGSPEKDVEGSIQLKPWEAILATAKV
jgi:glycosidase